MLPAASGKGSCSCQPACARSKGKCKPLTASVGQGVLWKKVAADKKFLSWMQCSAANAVCSSDMWCGVAASFHKHDIALLSHLLRHETVNWELACKVYMYSASTCTHGSCFRQCVQLERCITELQTFSNCKTLA